MAATNINRVILTGNLTRDPELRSLPSGTSLCSLRVAVNTRRKDGQTGEWIDKPNYFSVTVWGAQGDNCARYLSKGRPVAIDGRLEWREWEAKEGGKRESIEIIADSVQFLGGREGRPGQRQRLLAAQRRAGGHGGLPAGGSPVGWRRVAVTQRRLRRQHPLLVLEPFSALLAQVLGVRRAQHGFTPASRARSAELWLRTAARSRGLRTTRPGS